MNTAIAICIWLAAQGATRQQILRNNDDLRKSVPAESIVDTGYRYFAAPLLEVKYITMRINGVDYQVAIVK